MGPEKQFLCDPAQLSCPFGGKLPRLRQKFGRGHGHARIVLIGDIRWKEPRRIGFLEVPHPVIRARQGDDDAAPPDFHIKEIDHVNFLKQLLCGDSTKVVRRL